MSQAADSRRFMKIIFVAILLNVLVHTAQGDGGKAPWGYYEAPREQQPDLWKRHYKTCGKGRHQSPIEIVYQATKYPPEKYDKFTFDGFDNIPRNTRILMKNNGHTVVYTPQTDLFVDGGGLYGKYKLAQFHLHWGYKSYRGSEHTLDDVQYAAEIHFVLYSNSYSGLEEALGKLGGLAVLGVFVQEVDGPDNAKFQPLVQDLQQVIVPGDTPFQLRAFNLSDLFPQNMDVFYRYKGSLTTPPCTERVTWTVFDEPIKVSKGQMNLFRTSLAQPHTSRDGTMLMLYDNYRPVQNLHGRNVYVSAGRR